jgi:serine/threonine protein kinase/tetratricopeptide (TPR) repeat protein
VIGKTISHYRIVSKLGEGGMGVVYKAEDTKLKRFVALKFLTQSIGDDKARKRFTHEAQAVSALDHPNICAIYEIDEAPQGQMFIAMPCYEGETLHQKIDRGPLKLDEALDIAIQVASGLSKAHEKGVVHRDIKPGNIFLTNDGLAKIVDFGLAKLTTQTKLTKTGTTVGTAMYMSPEQARGEESDHRSDIWSLGVVLYEMISGRLPFRGEHEPAVVYALMNEDPEPLTAVRTGVPVELERIVGKCISKKPDERYQHADELAADLKTLKNELEAGRATPRSRAAQPTARGGLKKLWVPGAIVAALAIVFFLLKPMLFGEGPVAAPKPIAVISFENQTGDPSYDYLQEVIPNLLITSLEQSKFLSVVTWERLHDLLDQMGKKDVKLIDKEIGFEVCQKDGIDTIVLGSYSKAGDVFVTDVKVLDVRTKQLLKSAGSKGEGVESILKNQIDDLGRQISRAAGLSERKVNQSPSQPIADVTTGAIEAYDYFLRGRDEYDRWYYDNARKYLEKAVEIDSTFAIAHMYLAQTYNALRSARAANLEYERAMALSQRAPEKDRLYIEAQYAGAIEKDADKRVRIYRELVQKYPKEKKAYVVVAQYLRTKGSYAEAEAACKKALELDPNFGLALNEIAYLFMDKQDYETAIRYFERYASVAPGDANPYDSMAEAYFRMGNLDEAIDTYKKALEVKPDFGCERWIAYICALTEDYAGARSWLDRFITAAPSPGLRAQGYGLKMFFSAWVGRFDEAIENGQSELDLFDSTGNEAGRGAALWGRAWVHVLKGHFDRGRSDLVEGLDLSGRWFGPSRRSALSAYMDITLAYVDFREMRLESARIRLARADSLIREVALVDPMLVAGFKGQSRLVRSELYLAADSVTKAIEVAETARPVLPLQTNAFELLFPNLPPDRDVLARCYQKAGQIDKAIAEYERIITFDPRSVDRRLVYPVFHYLLARLYEEKGRANEAAAQYRKFLEICGNADKGMKEVSDARLRLARLEKR